MAIVTALEAKTRFGKLLERVSRGEEVVITKHDRPVARMVPEGRPTLTRVREAVGDIRALRREMLRRRRAALLTDREIRQAVAQGRP